MMSECNERRPFIVVAFPEDKGTLSVVPASWILKEKGKIFCRWPTRASNINKLIRMLQDPADDWDKIRANIMHYSTSYVSAVSYKNKFTNEVEIADVELTPRSQEISIISTPISSVQKNNNHFIRLEEKLDKICKTVEKLSQIVTNNAAILKAMSGAKDDFANECIKRISTFDEFQQLEDQMKDVKQFSKMANSLSVLGGKNEYEAIRRILSNLISHDLAIKMNWKGSNEKKAMIEYPHVIKLIAAAVKLDSKYKHVTQYAIENEIKRWLRYASDRNGGRLKRKKVVVIS